MIYKYLLKNRSYSFVSIRTTTTITIVARLAASTAITLLLITPYQQVNKKPKMPFFVRSYFQCLWPFILAELLCSEYTGNRFHTWIEVGEGLRFNAYKKIRFLRLENHIYTHNCWYLPFDAQSDSANEPSESAKRCQAHARRSFYVLQTY